MRKKHIEMWRQTGTNGEQQNGDRSKKTRQKWLITKKATSLQISDVDPRLKNDTTATTSARVVIRTTRLAVHPWSDRPRVGHGWSSGLLFLERKKEGFNLKRTQRNRTERTLLYLRISRTRLLKASSTLIRCLADVSMNLHPRCLARSRPSVIVTVSKFRNVTGRHDGRTGRRRCVGVRTIHADLPFVFQVALIGDQDDRETILVFYPQDLLVERADFLKGISGGDGIYKQESLARAHVLFPHGPANQKTGV